MKKFLAILLTMTLLAATLCGCLPIPEIPVTEPTETTEPAPVLTNLGTDLTLYPIYDNLSEDDKIIWDNICTAIENHSTERIHIGTYTAVMDYGNAQRRIGQMYRELVYSCPDYFWVSLYDFTVHTIDQGDTKRLELEISYLLDEEEAKEHKAAYDARVNEIVTAAQQIPDLFDRILYVYDTILEGAEYDHELADANDGTHINLSAYGCLVAGKTVCSGYALAFRSIMDKLGIPCGVEFNSYQYISGYIVGHVWNYCLLEGEYYYFDLTWDDNGFESENFDSSLPYTHLFFGLTREDLALSSYYLNEVSPIPLCTGTKYNYYRYRGLSFPAYDYEAVKTVLREHREDGIITLRFDTPEAVTAAKEDLIDDQRIFRILTDIDELSYAVLETDLHLLLIIK